MGDVDILDEQIEYYRTFIKVKNGYNPFFFLDLALVNSWGLYKNNCVANNYARKDNLTILDFRSSNEQPMTLSTNTPIKAKYIMDMDT